MTGFYNHDTPPRNIPLCFYKHPIGCLSHECNDLQETKLTDLAHSGQFRGKTWLPYTRIAQVQPSTTQQFNNHTSSSLTTHQFIERKLHVAVEKIATNAQDQLWYHGLKRAERESKHKVSFTVNCYVFCFINARFVGLFIVKFRPDRLSFPFSALTLFPGLFSVP